MPTTTALPKLESFGLTTTGRPISRRLARRLPCSRPVGRSAPERRPSGDRPWSAPCRRRSTRPRRRCDRWPCDGAALLRAIAELKGLPSLNRRTGMLRLRAPTTARVLGPQRTSSASRRRRRIVSAASKGVSCTAARHSSRPASRQAPPRPRLHNARPRETGLRWWFRARRPKPKSAAGRVCSSSVTCSRMWARYVPRRSRSKKPPRSPMLQRCSIMSGSQVITRSLNPGISSEGESFRSPRSTQASRTESGPRFRAGEHQDLPEFHVAFSCPRTAAAATDSARRGGVLQYICSKCGSENRVWRGECDFAPRNWDRPRPCPRLRQSSGGFRIVSKIMSLGTGC